jgi:hypothetical protein
MKMLCFLYTTPGGFCANTATDLFVSNCTGRRRHAPLARGCWNAHHRQAQATLLARLRLSANEGDFRHADQAPLEQSVTRPARLSKAVLALALGLFGATLGALSAYSAPKRLSMEGSNAALAVNLSSFRRRRSGVETVRLVAAKKSAPVENLTLYDPVGEQMARNRFIASIVVGVTVAALYLYSTERCKRDNEEEEKRIRAEVARLEKWKSEFVDAKQSNDVNDEDLLAALRERLQQQQKGGSTDIADPDQQKQNTSESDADNDDDNDIKLRRGDDSPSEHPDSDKRGGKHGPSMPPSTEQPRAGSGGAATLDRPGADRGRRSSRGRSMDSRSGRHSSSDDKNPNANDGRAGNDSQRDSTANWDLERERLRKLFNLDSGSSGTGSDDTRKGDR